jgi:hypothetical protein
MIFLGIGTQRSETLASRIYNKWFGPLLLVLLVLTPMAKAAQWRDFKPLRSTREDVLKELGKPKIDRADYSLYQFQNERVSFEYSMGGCGTAQNGWKVPRGTVTRIWVEPTTQLPFADSSLDKTKYKKERDSHVLYVYYFTDEREGIRYTVDDSAGSITMIEYFPTHCENKLRCQPARDPVKPKP